MINRVEARQGGGGGTATTDDVSITSTGGVGLSDGSSTTVTTTGSTDTTATTTDANSGTDMSARTTGTSDDPIRDFQPENTTSVGSTDDSSTADSVDVRDRTGGPTGAGNITTSVDPNTGDASQSITGRSGGTATGDATDQANDPEGDNVTVETSSGRDFTDRLEETEQAVEEATGGGAFGDSDTVNDVTDTSEAVSDSELPNPTYESEVETAVRETQTRLVTLGERAESNLPLQSIAVAASLVGLAVTFVGGISS